MHAFWEIVVSNALLVAVLAVGVALLGRIWKNPMGLHFLWLLVLLKLVTPPLMTIPVPLPGQQAAVAAREHQINSEPPYELRVETFGEEIAPATMNRQGQDVLEDRPIPTNTTPSAEPVVSPSIAPRHGMPWLTILAWTWGVGIAAIGFRQAYRILRFLRLVRAAQAPSSAVRGIAEEIGRRLGLRRTPEIRMLPVRMSPLVWSLGGKPQMLLPAELFERLDATAQEAILAHELAHVRRKDHLVRLLELLITTLFWWHPVVWWACRELQELEDQCCDWLVVGLAPHGARTYAAALLDTLDFLCDGSVAAPLGATAAKSSVFLARRIKMLKNRTPIAQLTLGRLILLTVVAAVPMAVAFAAKPPQAEEGSGSKNSRLGAAAPATEQPKPWHFERLELTAEDLAAATFLDIYKFRIDIPEGQRFRIVLREWQDERAPAQTLQTYDFLKKKSGPTTIRVSFTRRDKKLSGVLLSDEELAEYRVAFLEKDCSPSGIITHVKVPLNQVKPEQKFLFVSPSSSEVERLGSEEVRLLTIIAKSGKPDELETAYPRATLVIEPLDKDPQHMKTQSELRRARADLDAVNAQLKTLGDLKITPEDVDAYARNDLLGKDIAAELAWRRLSLADMESTIVQGDKSKIAQRHRTELKKVQDQYEKLQKEMQETIRRVKRTQLEEEKLKLETQVESLAERERQFAKEVEKKKADVEASKAGAAAGPADAVGGRFKY